MKTTFQALISITLLSVVAGCASYQKNPPLAQYDGDAGYRFDQLELGPGNTDDLFVVLSFSGGGTRAASLAYGVLEALEGTKIEWQGEEKSLLDEVDMITSVSGGSFTSGYYSLFRKKIFDGRYEDVFLNQNIEAKLFWQLLNPVTLINVLASSTYSRSDLAADYYNRVIFNNATYNDLVVKNQRPFLLINSTDMTMGSQFQFIQDQFDLICSDLSGVHLARAVATSSAFPGLLSPLTYKNYAEQKCGYSPKTWVEPAVKDRRLNAQLANIADIRQSYYKSNLSTEGHRNYVHLIDGGVVDNIGLRGITDALEYNMLPYSIVQKLNLEEIKKILIIVVDAAGVEKTRRDKSPAVPGIFDNIYQTASVPVGRISDDTINLIEAKVEEFNKDYEARQQCGELLADECPAVQSIDPDALQPVDLYISEVSFDFIEDVHRRFAFQTIPTNFDLSPKVNKALFSIACELLVNDERLKELLGGDDGFTGTQVTGTLPDCPAAKLPRPKK
ncbi:MAG: hypothetical protein COB20_07625 [SAR86 cluster bacterium]|uniref:PNPLA domain-containing protein n=1 Tax=SAR86 cluster bacterium TaxID=2030880 RepID=A0A2A4X6A0_9GAMM|nr:MAG: hypothetical protein COB20_07625 [SAR86 cluster bacterium]